MAQNTNITVTGGAWTQLTNANTNSITFQSLGGRTLYVKGTTGAVAPTDFDGALRYEKGEGELNQVLADLWPGISAVRVYAYCDDTQEVAVSHG